jgi:hypothetical protein
MIAGAVLVIELLLLAAGLLVVYRVFENRNKVNVGDTVPELFPVVVVTPGGAGVGHHATVVWHRDLGNFLAMHTEHSFRIPEGETASLRAQVEAATRAGGSPTSQFWFATFKVQTRRDGIQDLEVEGTGDDDWRNTSWYEVRDESITAMRHLHYFGPVVGLAFVPIFLGATLLNLALWKGGRWFFRLWKLRAAQQNT